MTSSRGSFLQNQLSPLRSSTLFLTCTRSPVLANSSRDLISDQKSQPSIAAVVPVNGSCHPSFSSYARPESSSLIRVLTYAHLRSHDTLHQNTIHRHRTWKKKKERVNFPFTPRFQRLSTLEKFPTFSNLIPRDLFPSDSFYALPGNEGLHREGHGEEEG